MIGKDDSLHLFDLHEIAQAEVRDFYLHTSIKPLSAGSRQYCRSHCRKELASKRSKILESFWALESE
jgi:hypothetical protein